MTPFFHSNGGNQIDVVVNTARKVDCFSWGTDNGAGLIMDQFSEVETTWGVYFATNGYLNARMMANLNLVICKATKGTAGTKTTGDVVIIPATQTAPDVSGVNNPFDSQKKADKPFSSSMSGMMSGLNSKAAKANLAKKTDGKNLDVGDGKRGLPILAGSDAYLGTMTHLSDASIAFHTTIQADDLTGADKAKSALPNGFKAAALNSNAGG